LLQGDPHRAGRSSSHAAAMLSKDLVCAGSV
jgi:hypothetical protein